MPERLPQLGKDFLRKHLKSDYKTLAQAVLAAFELDVEQTVIDQALDTYDGFDDPSNPVPVIKVRDKLYLSELYHGPTRAFKDMALQPFGVVLSALAQALNQEYMILAATSGDTGPATLDTFRNRPGVRVSCLYPDGGTSEVQRRQMVNEDASNLKVIGIRGVFDDAQTALKALLSSTSFHAKLEKKGIKLSAANSVNFGRIIFQQIYHIYSYLELVRQGAIKIGDKVYLNVPSGNFGNALAGYYTMKMGLPVEKILISSNANNVLTGWIHTGCYDLRQREVVGTSSPAMDILGSSNVERILCDLFGPKRTKALMEQLKEENYYQLTCPEIEKLQSIFSADFATDAEVAGYINDTWHNHRYLMDPHTATCFKTARTCAGKDIPMIVYSTAEWTKFAPDVWAALKDQEGLDDRDALSAVEAFTGARLPSAISALFEKEPAQDTVIDKGGIEEEILRPL